MNPGLPLTGWRAFWFQGARQGDVMEPAQEEGEGKALKREIVAAIEAEIASIMAGKLSRRALAVELAIARVTLKDSQEFLKDYEALTEELTTALAYAVRKKIDMQSNVVRVAFSAGKVAVRREVSKRAQDAANALHDKPGNSRDKKAAIRAMWATGKYKSRAICAEQECAALNMSFDAARKALRNTPDSA